MTWTHTLLQALLIISMALIYVSESSADRQSVKFEYSIFNDYYIECMSFHDGTGTVEIFTDGKVILTCADGYHPDNPLRLKVGDENIKRDY